MDGDAEEEGAAVDAAGLGVALRKPFFMARDGPNTLHRRQLLAAGGMSERPAENI